jgi:hypothetical protein
LIDQLKTVGALEKYGISGGIWAHFDPWQKKAGMNAASRKRPIKQEKIAKARKWPVK